MKLNRTSLFIAVSSLALFTVLVIQVEWIFQTAKIKEELFNEKANMVVSKTAQALSSDKETCKKMEEHIGLNEINKTDSLFNRYMNVYDFPIEYSFEVLKTGATTSQAPARSQNVYKQNIVEQTDKNGLELNLFIPGKTQFIIEEMGILFITSVVLILVVLFMFWRTTRSLMREKKISEYTTDFLNNMTHEFKTPLTNIALAGKMINREPVVMHEEKIKHYSGIILEENEKLRLQVEQVLSMTALERGEIPLQKTRLNFHELIGSAMNSINIQLENKQGSLKPDLRAKNFWVMGDKTHLINALRNLLDNAIKYSGGKPQLAIHTYNINENLLVVVSDKGIGIDKKYHEKVFDKFFRIPTGNVHNVKGFGLGLAYVKKIVELHKGKIGLQSEKGTTFTITLPHA